MTINLGVVAAIRAVGVRGDPFGAMRWTVYGRSQVECSVFAISKRGFVCDFGIDILSI